MRLKLERIFAASRAPERAWADLLGSIKRFRPSALVAATDTFWPWNGVGAVVVGAPTLWDRAYTKCCRISRGRAQFSKPPKFRYDTRARLSGLAWISPADGCAATKAPIKGEEQQRR